MVIVDFEKWPFLCFLEAKVVNLGAIDFQLGLPLNINGNDGQIKFEVQISKNVAKIAEFWPKIGQDATFALILNVHNSIIFDFQTYQNDKLGETN